MYLRVMSFAAEDYMLSQNRSLSAAEPSRNWMPTCKTSVDYATRAGLYNEVKCAQYNLVYAWSGAFTFGP